MKIFLSHASEVAGIAEAIELALSGEGHDVFLDRADLPSAETYNDRIRDAVADSDLFIFLISPEALAQGRYTLTELEFARHTWRHPSGRVLPVIVKPTDMSQIPAYLKAVTFLEPEGNVGAAVAAAVARLRQPWYRSARARGALILLLLAVAAIAWSTVQRRSAAAEVSALIDSARQIQRSGRYSAAWQVLTRADSLSGGKREVASAREELAMAWLDDIRITEGKESFASAADMVEPVLARCAAASERQRSADCQAHMGWAEFLRGREGGRRDPVPRYREALARDPGNVYAHAMWAFEINRTRGPIEAAREHNRAALASGRERAYVRHLQLAGLLWRGDAAASGELVRVANEMRTREAPLRSDPLIAADATRLWNLYYSQLVAGPLEDEFLAAVSPPDHLATFLWLFEPEGASGDKRNLYSFMLAGFQERVGDTAGALATYRRLRDVLAREGGLAAGGRVPDRTLAALGRLSK